MGKFIAFQKRELLLKVGYVVVVHEEACILARLVASQLYLTERFYIHEQRII